MTSPTRKVNSWTGATTGDSNTLVARNVLVDDAMEAAVLVAWVMGDVMAAWVATAAVDASSSFRAPVGIVMGTGASAMMDVAVVATGVVVNLAVMVATYLLITFIIMKITKKQ